MAVAMTVLGCPLPTLRCIVQPVAGGRETLFGTAQHILSGFSTFQTGVQGTEDKPNCWDGMSRLLWLLPPRCDPSLDGTAGRAAAPQGQTLPWEHDNNKKRNMGTSVAQPAVGQGDSQVSLKRPGTTKKLPNADKVSCELPCPHCYQEPYCECQAW